MMAEPPIVQYWDSPDPPPYITERLASFREQNPARRILVFDEESALRFIAERFGAREVAAFAACAIPAMQADYFRYCAILALGGLYADADYRCLTGLDPLVDGSAGGQTFLNNTERVLGGGRRVRFMVNCLFCFREPGHPLLRLTLDLATANIEQQLAARAWQARKNVAEAVWLTAGPGLFSQLRLLCDLGSFDAFLAAGEGTPAEPFAKPFCEVVGDYDRVAEAFEGVAVSPYRELTRWVEYPPDPLPYKSTDVDWRRWRAPIFR